MDETKAPVGIRDAADRQRSGELQPAVRSGSFGEPDLEPNVASGERGPLHEDGALRLLGRKWRHPEQIGRGGRPHIRNMDRPDDLGEIARHASRRDGADAVERPHRSPPGDAVDIGWREDLVPAQDEPGGSRGKGPQLSIRCRRTNARDRCLEHPPDLVARRAGYRRPGQGIGRIFGIGCGRSRPEAAAGIERIDTHWRRRSKAAQRQRDGGAGAFVAAGIGECRIRHRQDRACDIVRIVRGADLE